uniref:Putative mannoprotein n=1 Tax=Moniliophthora roreri TaxID=221103 RepID=A0A0W0G6Q4_MONRR
MSPVTHSALAALAAFFITGAVAQTFPEVPLNDKRFEYDQLPYRVDTDVGLERGEQYGYNICNSTTEGPESRCQTAIINSIEDFCLWGPPEPNSVVGDTEGEAVAYCTQPGRGTRLIPRGALTGVQFTRTPDYIQVVGFIDQTQINMQIDDAGGEMDPHGADLRGNPMGGVLYTNAWSGNGRFQQVIQWHNFMGNNYFCLKACDPSRPNDRRFCEHIFDRIGCYYNAPSNAQDGVFESCLGDNQDFPGIYTNEAGQVQTYTQPPEELGQITSMPYQPKVPASSQCTQYESTSIYAALAAVEPSGSGPAGSAPTGGAGASASGRPTNTIGSSARPTSTGSSSGTAEGSQATGNGAIAMGVSTLSAMGVVLSAFFLV